MDNQTDKVPFLIFDQKFVQESDIIFLPIKYGLPKLCVDFIQATADA